MQQGGIGAVFGLQRWGVHKKNSLGFVKRYKYRITFKTIGFFFKKTPVYSNNNFVIFLPFKDCLLPQVLWYQVKDESLNYNTWKTTHCYFKDLELWNYMNELLLIFYAFGLLRS